jgi:uncharacterized protein YjdB
MPAKLRILVLAVCVTLPGILCCSSSSSSAPQPATGIALRAPASPVHPNDTTTLTVSAARNLSVRRLVVWTASDFDYEIKGAEPHDVSGNGPWSLRYAIPPGTIGELKVFVTGFETGKQISELTSNKITIPIDLGAITLTELSLKNPLRCDADPGFVDPIRLIGTFSDGVERNCSNVKLGTTYTSSDTTIVAIDAHGGVICLKQGTAMITAQYGGHETRADVRVYAKAP